MPADTTIRDGVLGTDEYGDWTVVAPLACGPLRADVLCVVVTGRTAQDVEKALATYDATRAWLARIEDEARRLRASSDEAIRRIQEADHA